MLAFTLIVTVFMLSGAYCTARGSSGYLGVMPVAFGIAIAPVCLVFSPFLLLLALLVTLVAVYCHVRAIRPNRFLAYSTMATLLAYGGSYLYLNSNLHETTRARNRYPLESLSARLSYESIPERQLRRARPANFDALPASQHLTFVEDRLQHESYPYRGTGVRTRTLQWLHEETVHQFVESPGFGVGRGVTVPSLGSLDAVAKISPITQPEDEYTPGKSSLAPMNRRTLELTQPFGQLHLNSITDFLHPRGYGYVRDRDHVAGFVSHRFTKLPAEVHDDNKPAWQARRVELISLLKHEQPVAYLSRHLPRMDELREAPTRQLDEHESSALTLLQKGEDLIVDQLPDGVRMVGSIRAVSACVKCHDAQRGDLLGAFSYVLRKTPTAR